MIKLAQHYQNIILSPKNNVQLLKVFPILRSSEPMYIVASNYIIIIIIAGSSRSYITYDFIPINNSCSGLALCSSQLQQLSNKMCSVEYGTDHSFYNLSPPILGYVNVPFNIPLLEGSTIYYYQVSANISSSLTVTLQGIQLTEECDQDEMLKISMHNQVLSSF